MDVGLAPIGVESRAHARGKEDDACRHPARGAQDSRASFEFCRGGRPGILACEADEEKIALHDLRPGGREYSLPPLLFINVNNQVPKLHIS